MAQRETSEHRRGRQEQEEPVEVATSSTTAPSGLDADVDAILDEIDEVLETNAEDFVKSFIQKGGE